MHIKRSYCAFLCRSSSLGSVAKCRMPSLASARLRHLNVAENSQMATPGTVHCAPSNKGLVRHAQIRDVYRAPVQSISTPLLTKRIPDRYTSLTSCLETILVSICYLIKTKQYGGSREQCNRCRRVDCSIRQDIVRHFVARPRKRCLQNIVYVFSREDTAHRSRLLCLCQASRHFQSDGVGDSIHLRGSNELSRFLLP